MEKVKFKFIIKIMNCIHDLALTNFFRALTINEIK
jgi:hypothetical protein